MCPEICETSPCLLFFHSKNDIKKRVWLLTSKADQEMYSLDLSLHPGRGVDPRNIDLVVNSAPTLPETNIAPENGWLEHCFPFGRAYFQGRAVCFREGYS